jgi:hypothetical protein
MHLWHNHVTNELFHQFQKYFVNLSKKKATENIIYYTILLRIPTTLLELEQRKETAIRIVRKKNGDLAQTILEMYHFYKIPLY